MNVCKSFIVLGQHLKKIKGYNSYKTWGGGGINLSTCTYILQMIKFWAWDYAQGHFQLGDNY